ncbi:hypothetical protein Vafri_4605 [Volvox africanus]|uniref:Fucosyltransferase n=1 Tax=Volvox africanus TaxID=51714 RepID=A0A8J4AUS6_9CHLO|nr:hypothetical protein Vafri_4605 [Volvox africanus]
MYRSACSEHACRRGSSYPHIYIPTYLKPERRRSAESISERRKQQGRISCSRSSSMKAISSHISIMSHTVICTTIIWFVAVSLVNPRFVGAWPLQDTPECPEPHRQMLQEYKTFHDANKHSPNAKYIVQTCWHGHCAGAGDRLRGALLMLRVAMHFKKVLIIDWKRPAPLNYFLTPNEIDWKLTGFEDGFFEQNNSTSNDDFTAVTRHGAATKEVIKQFKNAKMIITQNPRPFETENKLLPPIDRNMALQIGACYFNFLFKFNSSVEQHGEEYLRQMYGPRPVDFVAWHWRHWDVDCKCEKPFKISELGTVLNCAEELASEIGVDLKQRPVALTTDFNAMRQLVAKDEFRNIITANITSKHIDNSKPNPGSVPFEDTFVDLYMLSRARCIITSWSGFSKLAVWMGSRSLLTCHHDMGNCNSTAVQGTLRRRELGGLENVVGRRLRG